MSACARLVLMVSAVLVSWLEPHSAHGEPMTMSTAVATALARHPDVKSAGIGVLAKRHAVEAAGAELVPTLTATGNQRSTQTPTLTAASSEQPVAIETRESSGKIQLSKKTSIGTTLGLPYSLRRIVTRTGDGAEVEKREASLGFTVRQSLRELLEPELGGLAMRLAELDAVAEEGTARQRINAAAREVANAYLGAAEATSAMQVQEAAKTRAEAMLASVLARHREGKIGAVDRLDAERAALRAGSAFADAQAAVTARLAELARFVHDDPTVPVSTVDDFAFADADLVAVEEGLERYVAEARASRGDRRASAKRRERAELDALRTGTDRWPALSLDGSYTLSGAAADASDANRQVGSRRFPGWSIGATLEIPLTGSAKDAAHAAKLLEVERLQLEERKADAAIAHGIRRAGADLRASMARLKAARHVLEAERNNTSAQTALFVGGRIPAHELAMAELDERDAALREVDSRIAVARAALALSFERDALAPAKTASP